MNRNYSDPIKATDTIDKDTKRYITSAKNPEMMNKGTVDKPITPVNTQNEKNVKWYDKYPPHSPKQYYENLIKVEYTLEDETVPVRRTLTKELLQDWVDSDTMKIKDQPELAASYRYLGSYKSFTDDEGNVKKIAEYAIWTPNTCSQAC